MPTATTPRSTDPTRDNRDDRSERSLSLAKRMREYRLAHDLTYRQFSSLIGVSKTLMQRAERAVRLGRPLSLNDRNVYKIERFLKGVRAA